MDSTQETHQIDTHLLGKALSKYFKLPFFRGFPKTAERDFTEAIIGRLQRSGSTDYENAVASECATQYPHFRKGDAAAGRVAAKKRLVQIQKETSESPTHTK